jgi:hypothetical protein
MMDNLIRMEADIGEAGGIRKRKRGKAYLRLRI